MSRRFFQAISALFIIMALTGCGFTLRGTESAALPARLQQLNLQFDNNNKLGQALRRRLLAVGVELTQNNADPRLDLDDERSLERVVSVNRNIRAGEYELTMTSSFRLIQNSEILLDSGPITQTRIYEADPLNAAAKTSETELIKSEMRQDLINQILRSLQALNL